MVKLRADAYAEWQRVACDKRLGEIGVRVVVQIFLGGECQHVGRVAFSVAYGIYGISGIRIYPDTALFRWQGAVG